MVGKRNIQEDEILAEEVRKYPCLYDNSHSGCKEREIGSKMHGRQPKMDWE